MLLLPFLLALVSCGGGSGGGEAPSSGGTSGLAGALLPSSQQVDDAPAPLSFGTGPLPASADISASIALPPVRAQQLQDCIPFAFGYSLCTFEVAVSGGIAANQLSHQASPADLYAKLLAKEGEPCGSGTSAADALDILVHTGIQSLALSPYDGQCVNPSGGSQFGIEGYHLIKPSDTDSIKQVLADGHPVGFAVSLYSDMSSWGTTHHDNSVYTGSGSPTASGHGMLLVGYDDARGAWKLMNSWGTAWGNGGFFWMSYNTFAASTRVCYAVDGGGTSVAPDPGTPVIFLTFQAIAYASETTSAKYLVMPFQFDHAADILQARMISQGSGLATPWQPIHQWLTKSYFWWASTSPFPAGNYTLELQCQTSAGKPYTLSQTAALTQGGFTRSTARGKQAEASRATLAPLLTTRGGFSAGDPVLANGHRVVWKPK